VNSKVRPLERSRTYKGWATFLFFFASCFLFSANFVSPISHLVRFYFGAWSATTGSVTDVVIEPIQSRTRNKAWNGYSVNYVLKFSVGGRDYVSNYFSPGSEKKLWSFDELNAQKYAAENKPKLNTKVFYRESNPEIAFAEQAPLLDLLGPWVIFGGIGLMLVFVATVVLVAGHRNAQKKLV
jgi:hypothetical protein